MRPATSTIEEPDRDLLSIWTIYDHPSDYPASYVARRFIVRDGKVIATSDVLADDDLEAIRSQMIALGLFVVEREGRDDPNVIESWL